MADAYIPPDSVINFLAKCAGVFTSFPEFRQRQAFRLAVMLRNKSPKALRMAIRFDRGEISGGQLLELMD